MTEKPKEAQTESNGIHNETIQVIELENWEGFEEAIEKDYKKHDELREQTKLYVSDLLFRGHARKSWKLETTLERYSRDYNCSKQDYSWRNYWEVLRSIKSSVISLTDNKFDLPDFDDKNLARIPPGYELMIYIRHHGFPSPLLDWTISPYVAAFFAFSESKEDEDVAIFTYLEYEAKAKSWGSDKPHVVGLGPYAETHKRHHQQKCEYTICLNEAKGDDIKYISHERATFGQSQDIMKKYVIPSKERKKVLRKLNLMNINAYSLFGDEEGLMSMLAFKEIEGKK